MQKTLENLVRTGKKTLGMLPLAGSLLGLPNNSNADVKIWVETENTANGDYVDIVPDTNYSFNIMVDNTEENKPTKSIEFNVVRPDGSVYKGKSIPRPHYNSNIYGRDFFEGHEMSQNNISTNQTIRATSDSGVFQNIGLVASFGAQEPHTETGKIKRYNLTNVKAYDAEGNEQKVQVLNRPFYVIGVDGTPMLFSEMNQDGNLNHKNLVRVKSWKEILEKIEN